MAAVPETPVLIVFVGPNGAGKSTLRNLLLSASSLPFVNADEIAAEQGIDAYAAASIAEEMRRELFAVRKSFTFETVLSDPVGAKVDFLLQARRAGYRVVVHFVGLSSPEFSEARIFLRVTEGGHDVPVDKIHSRYPRTLANLGRLVGKVDELVIYDNTSSGTPYRVVARFHGKALIELVTELPAWLDVLDLPSLVTEETTRLA